VAGLVLIGSVGIGDFPQEFHTPAEVLSDGSEAGVRRKLSFLVSDPTMVTDAWVREESMINSSAGAAEALATAAGLLNSEANDDRQDARVRAERSDLPVLIVWGENDRWTPLSMGQSAHELLPGSHFVVMPGCGHAPYFEDPASFVDIVSEFVIKEGIR